MKLPQLALAELRRLTATPMARLALAALAIVPLLYGGIYLWANQDPYSNLDQVPVALVVEDEGSGTGDDRQNIGQDVAENVLDDGSFDWHLVNAAEAEAGVDNGDYDFSLTLPKTFTEDLLSASGEDPRPATIVLTTNDANSYLASTIGEQAVNRIQAQVREQVGEEAAVRMLTSIQQIRDGMVDAADGATQLADGLATASDGSSELADGTAQLATGAADLHDGAAQLADGTSALQQQTSQLPAQTQQLADGARQVADGNAQIAQAGSEVASVTGSIVSNLDGTHAEIVQRLRDAGLTEEQIAQVLQPLDALGTQVRDGNARVQEVNGQLQQLSSGASQVADGAAQLAAGTTTLAGAIEQLNSGAGALADGSAQLESGASDAADGAADLNDGLVQLSDGAVQLRDGLDDGVAKIPEADADLIDRQAATIAAPVETDTESVTTAGTYGAGLAPFFVALAAWIGIYALMLIIKPFSKRAITALRSPLRVGAAAWITPSFFGVLQMTALFGVIAVWLGFNIAMPMTTLGFMMLSSVTFAAIIVALNVWLGSVGQFLGLVLMVLQLVVAGGTFPWQTLPGPLAALHHLVPMSYSVDGLRQVMYGGNMAAAQTDALVLLGFLVAAFALIVVGSARMMHHRTMRDLQPSLIG